MTEWLKNAIFYEIYPQTFADTNADGIGDIQGIINHLDYIKELGCNAIWLNPCFESPFLDAGYDVSDYRKVAPRYGTNADLKRLFDETHKRDMHVMLDLVPGHTSWEHPWFKESLKPEKNEYSGRFVWSDDAWNSFEGVGSIMGFMRGLSQRNACVAVNFYSHQPCLNYGFYEITEPSWQQPMDSEDALATRKAIQDIMRFWLDMGCDGFRVDMAHSLVKNDPERKGTIKLWQELLGFLRKDYPNAAMVSEWGQPDQSLQSGYDMDFMLHFGPSHYPDMYHADNPYFSREGKGNAKTFIDYYKKCYEPTNGKGMICMPSGNHDMERLTKWLDDEEVKIVFAFLLSLPGAPFIYYGDEIGMQYLADVTSVEGGYIRTGSRSPMQWNSGLNAGFSEAKPEDLYIPIDPNKDRPTAEKQMADPNSIYHEVKKLIAIRQANTILQSEAKIEFVYCEENAYPLAYRRIGEDGKSILIVVNPSGKEASFPYEGKLGEVLYQNGGDLKLADGKLTIAPASAVFVWEA
ncbi:MAG: glycosylase [Oscillospiraceae bacterium]|nr:glycosylase [Oscillospiraceae bacterium]